MREARHLSAVASLITNAGFAGFVSVDLHADDFHKCSIRNFFQAANDCRAKPAWRPQGHPG